MVDKERQDKFRNEARAGIIGSQVEPKGAMRGTWVIEKFSRLTLFGRRHFWRMKSANSEIICQSEGVVNRADRDRTIERMQANAGIARVIEVAK